MRSLLAAAWDVLGLRSTADEGYDPDAVIHVADDEQGFYGASAYCGYVFTEGETRSGRFAEDCPACIDVLGHVPGDPPPDDDEYDDEDEDDYEYDDEDEDDYEDEWEQR